MEAHSGVRITYLDVARGITILLTVAFHVLGETFLPFHHFVASMCLTVFFYVSGYFYHGFRLKNVFMKLILPYWGVLIFVRVIWSVRTGEWALSQCVQLLEQMLLGRTIDSMWPGQSVYAGIIWFLPLLACARLVYAVCIRLARGKMWLVGILCLACSGIGVAIGVHGIRLPWSLDAAMAAIPFMWLGAMIRQSPMAWTDRIASPVSLLVLLVLWSALTYTCGYSELAMRIYPYGLLWLVISGASTLFTIGLSVQIDRHLKRFGRMLAWCGRYSIVILIAHVVDKSCVVYPDSFPMGWKLLTELLWAVLPVIFWYAVRHLQQDQKEVGNE